MRLAILANGIAHELTETDCGRYSAEHVQLIVEQVNTDLVAALKAVEVADKAYEPYWRRTRLRRQTTASVPRVPKRNPTTPEAVSVQ